MPLLYISIGFILGFAACAMVFHRSGRAQCLKKDASWLHPFVDADSDDVVDQVVARERGRIQEQALDNPVLAKLCEDGRVDLRRVG